MTTNTTAKEMMDYLDSPEYFDAIEQSILSGQGGFGNPDSKWTPHEQFLLWKQMIQSGRFQSRDEYCNILVAYSSYQQALQHLGYLDQLATV
jgi:hypothetical protein